MIATSSWRRLCEFAGKSSICHASEAAFCTSPKSLNLLQLTNINQNTRNLEYAVRGPLVMKAVQLDKDIKAGKKKPDKFSNVIFANIGDCHAMNQKPLTFFRSVLAGVLNESLLDNPATPKDVKQRVKEILNNCDGRSVGSYSDACGLEIIRKNVANYIVERERGQVDCDWRDVFLSNGASEAVKVILSFINHSNKANLPVGVMIPIPQYPLYSATLCEFGMNQVNYFLDEENDWSLSIKELERAYKAEADKCDIRAIVIINPGNPTGSVLSETNIIEILDFAKEHELMVIADEVYQHNIYGENLKFHSFKGVMSQKTNYQLELASLMSASKGYMGECGMRGGYCELTNFNPEVRGVLYKGLSARLCPSILGQITMDLVVRPPKPNEESFELFENERSQVLADLKHKARLVANTFNSVQGIKSNQVAGAMYAFPRLALPERAVEEARKLNCTPDFYYATQFLENYGVCIVPGSGFGQLPGSYHFRTTILPQPDVFEDMMNRFKSFHSHFLQCHS